MNMNGEGESIQCSMQDGVLMADGASFALRDGLLVVSADGMTMTLGREKPEALAETVPAIDESATIDDLKGVWTLARVTMDGVTLARVLSQIQWSQNAVYVRNLGIT